MKPKKDYNYLNNRYTITENQFKNLITFLVVLLNEDVHVLATMSPDYMLEKFSRYICKSSDILDNENHLSGAHEILYRDFIKKYHKFWGKFNTWEHFVEAPLSTTNFIDDN